MSEERVLTWIHLGGLGGCPDDHRMWPAVQDALLEDLRSEISPQLKGIPDIVFLTGSLASEGQAEEYGRVEALLKRVEAKLETELCVVAVPGPGDMLPAEARTARGFAWLRNYDDGDEEARRWREELWQERDVDGVRRSISERFGGFGDFHRRRCWQRLGSNPHCEAMLPGDFGVSLELGGLKLGVVGLNSAWRRCGGVEVCVEPTQLHTAVKPFDGPLSFAERHHLCVLVQHHSPHTLTNQDAWEGTVEPRFGLGLFGGAPRWQREKDQLRIHGGDLFEPSDGEGLRSFYHWGQARVRGNRVEIKVWPRKFVREGEVWRFRHHQDAPGREADGLVLGEVEIGRALFDEAVESVVVPSGDAGTPERAIGAYMDDALKKWSRIPVLGFEDSRGIDLDIKDVYVELQISTRRELARFHGEMEGKGREAHFESVGETRKLDLADAVRMAEAQDVVGLVLLGEPGAGKTTLLKHVFVEVALGRGRALGWDGELHPFFFRARRIDRADLKPRGLEAIVRGELGREGFDRAAQALVESKTPMLFLIDGLDEVGSDEMRREVCAWLSEEIALWPGSRFVLSCRYAGWSNAPELMDKMLRADVLQLSDVAIEQFIGRWYDAVARWRGRGEMSADERSKALLEVLRGPGWQHFFEQRRLVRNPLLLSTLCLVHYKDHVLPDERGVLYERCLKVLLEQWPKHADRRALTYDQARHILQPLAWEMQERGVIELSREAIRDVIKGPLEFKRLDLTWNQFLQDASRDCGVLMEVDLGRYQFFHRSFQEFLAARHAQSHGLADALVDHMGEKPWKEVILLAMTLDGVLRLFAREAIRRRLVAGHMDLMRSCLDDAPLYVQHAPFEEALDVEGDPETMIAILSLFGGQVPESFKARVRGLGEHGDEGVRRAVKAFLGTEALENGSGERGPKEGEVRVLGGLEFVWVPPGPFWMGASKDSESPLYDPEAYSDEGPGGKVILSRGYWMGRFPVTNAEYGEFLSATDHREPEYWGNNLVNKPKQPVIGVDWHEARAFCQWMSAEGSLPDGFVVELPSEAQWERAARGIDGRRYPWGNEDPDETRAWFNDGETSRGRTVVVGERTKGISPVGCHDMAGNVWEWCLDVFGEHPTAEAEPVDPCHQGDKEAGRVLRGGSWMYESGHLRCASRRRSQAHAPAPAHRVSCVVCVLEP